MNKISKNSAFISITLMILVGGICLLILLLVTLSSIDLLEQGANNIYAKQTFNSADACAEEAILELNLDKKYTGETLSLGAVECIITISGTGNTRTIDVLASQGEFVNRLQIEVTLHPPPLTIDNWEQVD